MTRKELAVEGFWRSIKWIAVLGVLTVAGALAYLRLMDTWTLHAIIATILGVFVSIMLGCGLFALGFYSDKSGHDDDAARTTSHRP